MNNNDIEIRQEKVYRMPLSEEIQIEFYPELGLWMVSRIDGTRDGVVLQDDKERYHFSEFGGTIQYEGEIFDTERFMAIKLLIQTLLIGA